LKDFFKRKGWRICFAAYIFIYLPWFSTLEKVINSDYPGLHIINIPFDNMIPFCEYFIIPYVLWFLYVVAACIYMYFKADNKEFIQFALSLIIGMSLSLTICMIYPNGLTLRPDNIPDNIFGKLVAVLYATDTTTNVFPSIHVYNSIAVHTALSKCKALKEHKYIVNASLILCILICLSTIFLKQHSVYDVIGGIVLMAFMYFMLYILPERNTEAKCEAESQQQSITD